MPNINAKVASVSTRNFGRGDRRKKKLLINIMVSPTHDEVELVREKKGSKSNYG